MSSAIQYAVHFEIGKGNAEDFKALMSEASREVEETQPWMLGYQWYMNDEESECTLIEQYERGDLVPKHMELMAKYRARLSEMATISIKIYGDVDEATREALKAATVQYHRRGGGFARY